MKDAATAHADFLATRHFPALDGLRCLSILAVIWHHAGGFRHGGLLGAGHHGVSLFFGISGFLITTLLLRERRRNGSISMRGFYTRRTLRIFPLYYAVLALYVLSVLRFDGTSAAGQQFFRNLPFFASYTSNIFIDFQGGARVIFYFAWSLATEEQFYAVWPWIVRAFRGWLGPVTFMLAGVAVSQGTQWAAATGWIDGKQVWVRAATSIAIPICLGSVSAYAVDSPGGFRAAWSVCGRSFSAVGVAAGIALCLALGAPDLVSYLFFTALVLCCTLTDSGWARGVLTNRGVTYVGTVSYGMYLLHMLSLNAVRRALPNASEGVLFAVTAAVAVVAASLSYRFFERRFLLLKQAFAS